MIFVRKARLKDIENIIKLNIYCDVTDKNVFNNKEDYYVCINNDTICGYGTLAIIEDYCFIKNVYVVEEFRREKIGSMIVKTMLNVAEKNRVNIAICTGKCGSFIEYLGFKPININDLPIYIKYHLDSQNLKDYIYSVSLKGYFKCCCKK